MYLGPTCSLCDLFIFASSTGSLWCRRAHHPERTCVSAGQWGPHGKSLHLWPHSGRRFTGMKQFYKLLSLSVFFVVVFLVSLNLNSAFFSDTFDLWQRVYRGCWNEASGSAGSWASQVYCREGISSRDTIGTYLADAYKGKIWKINNFLSLFRPSNRSRQPSSQRRETLRLPCSLPML